MNDTETLARTLWGESRGEGDLGIHAVANVVMNRVDAKKWWGLTPYEVCRKPWQFSCWNENDPNRAKLLAVTDADPIYAKCLQIAQKAVNHALPDITDKATHYFDKRMPSVPKWAEDAEPCAIIGHHVFYRGIQ
jgi:spore germination cell wall hydrolase CwlJ-like protein